MASLPDRPSSVSTADRITNLDTVRGLATLGILVMNGVSFALPEAAYFNLDAAGSRTWLDWVIGLGGEVLVDQKAMALFSLLFGAGTIVFVERAQAKGRRASLLGLWRFTLLLGIGALHGLLWEGDVLRVYALCAPLILVLRKVPPRWLLGVGSTLVLASALVAVGAQRDVPPDGAGLGTFWFVGGGEIGDSVGVFLLADFFLRSAGMMLIGVALYRLGIVQGQRSPELYRRMARYGLGIGLPLAVAGVVLQIVDGFSPRIAIVGEVPNTLATIPVTLGYLGLASLWNRRPATPAHHRIRAVGRMALTNYIAHTLAGITLFRILLHRGDATRTGVALFVIAVWAIQLRWSQRWLSHYRFGPLEWAWRAATYRRLQPFRRHPVSTIPAGRSMPASESG